MPPENEEDRPAKREADQIRANEMEIAKLESEGLDAVIDLEQKNARVEAEYEAALRDRTEMDQVVEDSPAVKRVKEFIQIIILIPG